MSHPQETALTPRRGVGVAAQFPGLAALFNNKVEQRPARSPTAQRRCNASKMTDVDICLDVTRDRPAVCLCPSCGPADSGGAGPPSALQPS